MTYLKTVSTFDGQVQRQYGRGLFAGRDEFRLTDKIEARASVAKCMIGNMVVGEVRSTGHEVDVREPFGVSVLVPLKGSLVSEASGVTYCAVSGTSALLFSPNRRRTRVIATDETNFLAIPVIVPFTEITDAAERLGIPSSHIRRAKSFNFQLDPVLQQASGELLKLCLTLHSEVARGTRRLALPGAHAQWSDLISEKIVELLEEADILQMPKVAWDSSNGRHVTRAMEYMRANLAEIEVVSKVAEACGISSRTLEHAFKGAMGMTPMQVLTIFRLDEARAMLLDRYETASVTDVALACGFRHLGRFARAYGDRFGELPSETLRRA